MPTDGLENQVPPGAATEDSTKAKMFEQSEVDRIKREASQAAFQEGFNKGSSKSSNAASSGISPEDLDRRFEEKMAQKEREWQQKEQDRQRKVEEDQQKEFATHTIRQIHEKEETARKEIPDYNEVISGARSNGIKFEEHPHILAFANTVDNSAHVLYDLAKNPSKIGQFYSVMNTPGIGVQLATSEMKRLSDSLKRNSDAQSEPGVKEPVGNIRPSKVGIDSGKRTVADYKKMYRR